MSPYLVIAQVLSLRFMFICSAFLNHICGLDFSAVCLIFLSAWWCFPDFQWRALCHPKSKTFKLKPIFWCPNLILFAKSCLLIFFVHSHITFCNTLWKRIGERLSLCLTHILISNGSNSPFKNLTWSHVSVNICRINVVVWSSISNYFSTFINVCLYMEFFFIVYSIFCVIFLLKILPILFYSTNY